jgi:hypothetical protein
MLDFEHYGKYRSRICLLIIILGIGGVCVYNAINNDDKKK